MSKKGLLAILLLTSALVSGQVDPYMAGRAFMSQKMYDSAAIYLEKALKVTSGDAEILFQLGISYFKGHNYPAAREAFYEVEKRRNGMGSYYLAKTEVKLSHSELALKYLRTHLSSRYKKPEHVILLDEELSTLEDTKGWHQLWNEKKWYNSGDIDFQEAMFLKDNNNYLEAINLMNKLEKQGYKRSLIHTEKATIYKELGNVKASRSELRSAVKSDVRNLDAVQQLARIQIEEGSGEEAVAALTRVIRQDPARFEAYILRAKARSLQRDLSGALEDMDLYLTYFPEDDDAIYKKGLIQYENGKYLNAIQSFNLALSLDKGKAAYYFARGKTYASTGTNRYADKDMAMALDLDPLNGEIWLEKGRLSEKLGDRIGACHCFHKAFQYGIYEASEFLDNFCNGQDGNRKQP